MTTVKHKPSSRRAPLETSYDADFFAWTVSQASALDERRTRDVDWRNVAEEIRGLGNSEKDEIESRLLVLLTHLLKWQHQPGKRKVGWAGTIREQRRRIRKRIERSPSLASYPDEVLSEEYADARLNAADETELDLHLFPETCSFTIEEILDSDFYPDPPGE